MSTDALWGGWLALFLIYEIVAAISERGTEKELTLSRNVWRWFDTRTEKAFLAVFLLTLTAHLVLGRPGGLAIVATGIPVAFVIAREFVLKAGGWR